MIKKLCTFFLAIILLCSCDSDHAIPIYQQQVVIAYLAAENSSLSSEVTAKVKAMALGCKQLDMKSNHLLVYADRIGTNPVLMEVTSSSIDTLFVYDNQNSADGKIMQSVINRALSYYPSAARYGIIFFSHGTAWLPAGGFNNPGNYSFPDSRSVLVDADSEMDLMDFATYLPFPNSKPWDFMLFENCFMGSVEVAYQLKNKTNYIVASESEVISPGYTGIYSKYLYQLFETVPDLNGFAQSFFNYWASYPDGDERQSATVSVINTEYLDELATLVSEALQDVKNNDDIYQFSMQHFDANGIVCDLKDVVLKINPEMEDRLQLVIDNVVQFKASTSWFLKNAGIGYYSYPINVHCGLSMYAPHSSYNDLNSYYNKLDWSIAINR